MTYNDGPPVISRLTTIPANHYLQGTGLRWLYVSIFLLPLLMANQQKSSNMLKMKICRPKKFAENNLNCAPKPYIYTWRIRPGIRCSLNGFVHEKWSIRVTSQRHAWKATKYISTVREALRNSLSLEYSLLPCDSLRL